MTDGHIDLMNMMNMIDMMDLMDMMTNQEDMIYNQRA